MTEYRTTRDVAALAEVVYNTAGDLERLDRWLPAGVTAEHLEDGTVQLRWRIDDRQGQARLAVSRDADRLRMECRAEQPQGAGGWLEVGQAGAGAARVEVCVQAPGGAQDVMRALVDDALTGLQREVGENFTVS
ncbi:SRPBCC family protein [Nonomuraea sp. NPDC050783]|uniref:SRPBCC family protein n=1 Tax=Nonomuraea sp. NPDC050783 TaxID=3154634 RepID=UPI00346680F1